MIEIVCSEREYPQSAASSETVSVFDTPSSLRVFEKKYRTAGQQRLHARDYETEIDKFYSLASSRCAPAVLYSFVLRDRRILTLLFVRTEAVAHPRLGQDVTW